MYTRSYFTEEKSMDIPENYNGNAFEKSIDGASREENAESVFLENKEEKCNQNSYGEKENSLFSFIQRTPLANLLRLSSKEKRSGYLFGESGFKFGTEEILITAIALYMFFSKEGDKECAIMLIFLLFIS